MVATAKGASPKIKPVTMLIAFRMRVFKMCGNLYIPLILSGLANKKWLAMCTSPLILPGIIPINNIFPKLHSIVQLKNPLYRVFFEAIIPFLPKLQF